MSKSHSVEVFQNSPSVRKVISELEANFGKIKQQQQQLPFKSSLKVNEPKSSLACVAKADVPTQTECEVLESTLSTCNKTRIEAPTTTTTAAAAATTTASATFDMDSDSSVHEKQLPVPPPLLTTVSVSTCPSCGSENISSEGTKRSSSFQHLVRSDHNHRPSHRHRHYCKHISAHKATLCSKMSPVTMVPRSQSFQIMPRSVINGTIDAGGGGGGGGGCGCQCNCLQCQQQLRKSAIRAKRAKSRKQRHSHRNVSSSDQKFLSVYPSGASRYWAMPHQPHHQSSAIRKESCCSLCYKASCQSINRHPLNTTAPTTFGDFYSGLNRSRSFVEPVKPIARNYRYWDIDEWRAQIKREKAKSKERKALAMVCALSILVFICISYFGTILFLRVTKLS